MNERTLSLSPSSAEDVNFCWELYTSYVSPLIDKQIANGWNDVEEETKFRKWWNPKQSYIIILDGDRIGWMSGIENENDVLIENGYLLPEYRGNKIGQILLEQLKKRYASENKTVSISVLKDNPFGQFVQKFEHDIINENQLSRVIKLK